MISLSNLLKQCFVINHENEKRIINTDQRFKPVTQPVEEHVPDSEEILDGFLADLDAEEVYIEEPVDPQITAEAMIEDAKAEAERILASAKAEALKIADDAHKEAEMLFEQKKVEGYNTGASQLKSEIEAERADIQEELARYKQQLLEEHDSKMQTMEADIVDAMITVFNRVFDIQFDNKKKILLHLINNTLMNVEVGKEFHIRVSEANYKFIESHIGDIKEKIGNDIVVEIVNDMTLGPEDCVIETEFGVFNCGIDMELANLEKDIRSLCS